MELSAYGVKVSYRREDGYSAKRNAILLMKMIEEAGEGAKALSGYEILLASAAKVSGEYDVAVDGKKITATAGGILAHECIRRVLSDCMRNGKAPESVHGCACKEFEDSNRFAFCRQGDQRVMFYNLLWNNDLLYLPTQRTRMATEIVREFLPDVVGFQETNKKKRGDLLDYNIELLMDKIGYKEVPVTVENSYRNSNSTPLFYNTEAVECLDGAYVWYRDQAQNIGTMDQSSKSMTWGLFEDKKTKARFIAASTHMCTQVDEIREKQTQEASELFAKLHEKYGVPIILGGDFNSKPTGLGFVHYHDVMKYPYAPECATVDTCDTKTYHPYPEMDPETGLIMPKGGATPHRPDMMIDHIFCPYIEEKNIKVFGVVVNDYTLASSDHFPVYVDFSV